MTAKTKDEILSAMPSVRELDRKLSSDAWRRESERQDRECDVAEAKALELIKPIGSESLRALESELAVECRGPGATAKGCCLWYACMKEIENRGMLTIEDAARGEAEGPYPDEVTCKVKEGDRVRLKHWPKTEPEGQVGVVLEIEDGRKSSVDGGRMIVVELDEECREDECDDGIREMGEELVEEILKS